MSKKLIVILIVTVTVFALFASTVAAQERDATLDNLFEQIYALRRQVVERRVELDQLTSGQGEKILQTMEKRHQRFRSLLALNFYNTACMLT
jgi:hypothetical protein